MEDQSSLEERLQVLIVDDDDGHRSRAAAVVRSAYPDATLAFAADYDSALTALLGRYQDLVLLDLSLHSGLPGPQEGFEGLWLLQDIAEHGLREHIPVVVLTAFGDDPELAAHAFRNFRVVDFWTKAKSEGELAGSLRSALEGLNTLGLRCKVSFKEELSWDRLVKGIHRLLTRPEISADLSEAELELRHLLRKLFSDCAEIEVSPLEPGLSGAAVLKVAPVFEDGSAGADVVVKYGGLQQIRNEVSRFGNLAPYMRGHRSTQLQAHCLGRRLGAIRYTLVGGRDGRMDSFTRYYSEHTAEEIKKCLTGLFQDSCGLLYARKNRTQTTEIDLEKEYFGYMNSSRDAVAQAFEFKYGDKPLSFGFVEFPALPRRLRHPIASLVSGDAAFSVTSWKCRTHGDLHGGNILVDPDSGDAWLIDFFRAGLGHWVRDFVALEACIRFQLLPAHDVGALFPFEEALSRPTVLTQGPSYLDPARPELMKAAQVIGELRAIAGNLSEGEDPGRAMEDYYIGLFYETVNYVRLHKLIRQPARKHQVLLSAALLFERVVSLRGARR